MGAGSLRIFISHSSHTAEATEKVQQFVDALESSPGELQVLWDRGVIDPGDEWRTRIDWMLFECDAAVVLLTPESLASGWVRRESANLCWISRVDRGPRVFPILWDDGSGELLTRDDIKRHPDWAAIDITAINFLNSGVPEDVAARLKKQLAEARPPRSILDLLALEIVAELSGFAEESLRAALTDLGDRVETPSRSPHPAAATLARWFLQLPPPSLASLTWVLNRLGPRMTQERAQHMVDRFYPLWIAPDAAGWLRRVRQPDPPVRSLALRCGSPVTVDSYLGRAYLLMHHPEPFVLTALAGEGSLDDAVENAVSELRELVRVRFVGMQARARYMRSRRFTEEDIDTFLADTERDTFVVLQLPDQTELIEKLQRRLPAVSFVYHGADVPTSKAGDRVLPDSVGWIVPQHELSLEERALTDYEVATREIDAWGTASGRNGQL